MIKKYSKFLLMILCCFIGLTSVSAREMTLDELEVELNKISPNATYIYVIGEYAFSSTHEFTRQDNILAARSIKIEDTTGKTDKDKVYGEMTIYRYERVVDADYNPVGLKFVENMVGKTPHPDKLNIKYIDYVFVPDVSKAEIKVADNKDFEKLKDQLGIDFKNDDKLSQKVVDNNVTSLGGEIYYDAETGKNIFPQTEQTGFYYAFVVKVDNINNDTIVTIDGISNQTFTKSDFDENGEMVVLLPLDPNQEDSKKNIKINVDLDGDGKNYASTEYTIDYQDVTFKKVLDVDAALVENMDKVETDKIASSLKDGVLSVEQKDVVASLDTTGKALIDALKETLKTDGVKSIKLSYNDKEYILTEENIDAEIPKILAEIAGKDYDKAIQNDIIGKSLKMTVELEKGNITTVTPDDSETVEYTINFTGKKAENTIFNIYVDENHSAYTDKVKEWLSTIKFDVHDTNLKFENGKLTGTVLENKKIGNEFSSNPADLTGYYFTYVIELDKEVTDQTVVTLPANGSVKQLGKDAFDTKNSIVVVFALHRDKDDKDKVIEITVDLDGDGKDYLPTTLTIDYSEVQFLNAVEMLQLASDNTEESGKLDSETVISVETKDGEKYVTTLIGKADLSSKTIYAEAINNGVALDYLYITEKNDSLYVYESEDNTNWSYRILEGTLSESSDDLMATLFKNYKSIERVDSDEEGTIKLAVVKSLGAVELPDKDPNHTYYDPITDAIDYVYIKDNKISRIETDILAVFEDEVKAQFESFTQVITLRTFTETLEVPENIVKNAIKK